MTNIERLYYAALAKRRGGRLSQKAESVLRAVLMSLVVPQQTMIMTKKRGRKSSSRPKTSYTE